MRCNWLIEVSIKAKTLRQCMSQHASDAASTNYQLRSEGRDDAVKLSLSRSQPRYIRRHVFGGQIVRINSCLGWGYDIQTV